MPKPAHSFGRFTPPLVWASLSLAVIMGILLLLQPPAYYPSVRVSTPDGQGFLFLNQNRNSEAECQQLVTQVTQAVLSYCKTCTVQEETCRTSLLPSQQVYFRTDPLPYPIAYLPTGVMVFNGQDASANQQSCQTTSDRVVKLPGVTESASRCYPAEQVRESYRHHTKQISLKTLAYALVGMLLALFTSKLACYLVLRYEKYHAKFTHDHVGAGVQKFHTQPTPRIGGLPILLGLLMSGVWLETIPHEFPDTAFAALLFCALPAFLGGFIEDITKNVSVRNRLLLTMLSGLLGCILLKATLPRLDIPYLDNILIYWPLAAVITLVAVGGVANATNIIDGNNGLASGTGIISSLAFAYAAYYQGDSFVLFSSLAMTGALLGFFFWNWPYGQIFLGDGGAYILGFWLAELAILLVVRNPAVSPWFALVVMAHPIVETIYSIYRRTVRKTDPGQPDSQHLHQLVFRFIEKKPKPNHKIPTNSRVAPVILAVTTAFSITACIYAESRTNLMLLMFVYFLTYVFAYKKLKK